MLIHGYAWTSLGIHGCLPAPRCVFLDIVGGRWASEVIYGYYGIPRIFSATKLHTAFVARIPIKQNRYWRFRRARLCRGRRYACCMLGIVLDICTLYDWNSRGSLRIVSRKGLGRREPFESILYATGFPRNLHIHNTVTMSLWCLSKILGVIGAQSPPAPVIAHVLANTNNTGCSIQTNYKYLRAPNCGRFGRTQQ